MGDPDPEERAGERSEGHLAAPHVLGYGSMGRCQYSAQQQGAGARTYGLQHISSSVPNSSASGTRVHDYAIHVGGAAVQVVPGMSTVLNPVMATHAVIGRFFGGCFCFSACAALGVALGIFVRPLG